MNLNAVLKILRFNSRQQRTEPLQGPEVTADPEEVHLAEASSLLGEVHPVPYTLQNGCKGSDTNTSSHQEGNLILEYIFRCTPKRTIDVDTGQHFSDRRVNVSTTGGLIDGHNGRVALSVLGFVEIAAKSFGKGRSEVPDNTDVNRNIVFLGSTGQGERMVLPDRYLGATDPNILQQVSFAVDIPKTQRHPPVPLWSSSFLS